MKSNLILLAIFVSLGSCDKEKINPDAGNNVEFYLIDNYMTDLYDGTINESATTLRDSVLIGYDDIISYNSKSYDFRITAEAMEKLSIYEAFAVTVDKEIVYTGYFWTSFSSRSVNWIIIDLLFTENNTLHVQLGYPGLLEGFSIPDKRNDPRIIDVLRRDGKLID